MLSREPAPFSYPEVGATEHELTAPPGPGYGLDHHRFRIGRGRPAFERAREALFAWRHFEIPWVELYGADRPVHTGQAVATLVSLAGVWLLNPCRVVYAEPGAEGADRASFAYGTLTGHVLKGEERFRVSFSPATEEVHYEITAFSRPALWLARIGTPLMRRVQRSFLVSSARALERVSA